MMVSKAAVMATALTLVLAGPVFAQATPPPATPPAQQPPATQKPPAQPPAGAKPPALDPQTPPAPFPEGARVAYIFMQAIFNGSAEGKTAAAKVQEWEKKKVAEIQEKTKQVQAQQTKLQQSGTVLNDTARTQGERELQKLQRELQAMQEDAQQEAQDLRQQLLNEFSKKVNPVIAAIAKERGLHMIFSVADDANVAWADPGLNLTAEVIKRIDASTGAPKK